MKKRWQKMSAKDRILAIIATIFMLIGLYGMVIYRPVNAKRVYTRNMLHRKKDRLKKRATISNAKINVNPKKSSRQLKETEAEIARLQEVFADSEFGLAPLNDAGDVQQQLLLELSNLAKQTRVQIITISGKRTFRQHTSRQREISTITIDKRIGRPIVVLTARATYWQVVDFLSGLKELSYYASVMKISMENKESWEEKKKKSIDKSTAPLAVLLEIAI